MKRVLIITYYWPPSGGSGVQRWLKFSKYLPDFDWQPVIYTPSNPDVPVEDPSLAADIPSAAEIVKTRITEPYDLYRTLFGISRSDKSGTRVQGNTEKKGKGGLKSSVANFIRANFFIPDPRFLWIRPSVRCLEKYLKEHPVDAIVTTGPPHSMHLIGRRLSRKLSLPWIADFRDPWTGMFYFKHLKMLPCVRAYHRSLERKVVTGASKVIVVTNQMRKDFLQIRGADPSRIRVITNGYDSADFRNVVPNENDRFTLVHTGLMARSFNPENLWKVLGELLSENAAFRERFQIRLIGETDPTVFESLKENGLTEHTVHIPYLPHREAIREQMSASLLLLTLTDEPESKGILTGKFFEYLVSGRPILAIAPTDGDLSAALKECNAGSIFGFREETELKRTLQEHFENYLSGTDGTSRQNREAVWRYDRKALTGELVTLLNHLTKE